MVVYNTITTYHTRRKTVRSEIPKKTCNFFFFLTFRGAGLIRDLAPKKGSNDYLCNMAKSALNPTGTQEITPKQVS